MLDTFLPENSDFKDTQLNLTCKCRKNIYLTFVTVFNINHLRKEKNKSKFKVLSFHWKLLYTFQELA